eukprot:COSAG03_NODE_2734_length_2490_cov_1739.109996_3_plen_364_part_00
MLLGVLSALICLAVIPQPTSDGTLDTGHWPLDTARLALYLGHVPMVPCAHEIIKCLRHTTRDDGALATLRDLSNPPPSQSKMDALRWWVAISAVFIVLWAGFSVWALMNNFYQDDLARVDDIRGVVVPAASCLFAGSIMAFVLFVVWLFGLRLAATLATSPVDGLIEALNNPAAGQMTEEQWEERIREPLQLLSTRVLPLLAHWGRSISWIFVAGILASTGIAISIIRRARDDEISWWILVGVAVDGILGPVVAVALIPAAVSTKCVELLEQLNHLRLVFAPNHGLTRQDLHRRICEVEASIRNQNGAQGIGFVLFGVVVTKASLVFAAVKIGSAAATVVGFAASRGEEYHRCNCSMSLGGRM